MECKNCGTEYEGRFCPECGNECKEQRQTDCVTVCPQCGSERVGKGKFCVNCGYNYETRSSSNTATGGKINGLQSFISERKGVIYRVYRYLIAGGMLLAGVIALLCLAAPTMVEKFFGEINPLCTGFTAMIGGKGVDVPGSVVGASRALLAMSIIALIYGGVQLYWAFKRPFKTVRNYFCWALDGAIVFILLTLGAVVSAAGSSEELAGAQVGAGFAICIVMGVFGLLLLGARIFFELKLFSWADSGLSEEQIAKAREKKERKPLDKATVKKWAKRIGIPAAIAVVLVVAIVPAVVITSNIFRIGKVDKINIGDSSDRVIEVLGEPYVKDGNFYEYYDKEYVKLSEQIKEASGIGLLAARRKDDDFDIDLDEDIDIDDGDSGADKLDKLRDKLHNLTYKYIRIEFSSNSEVTSVLFDANRCDSKENYKVIESGKLLTKEAIKYIATDIAYRTEYTDGSLYKCIIVPDFVAGVSKLEENGRVQWTDKFGNYFTEFIKINFIENPNLKLRGVWQDNFYFEIDGNNNMTVYSKDKAIEGDIRFTKDHYSEFISNVTSIVVDENNATYYTEGNCLIHKESKVLQFGCKNSLIPDNVTGIGEDAFYGCSSLTSIAIPASVTSIGDHAFEDCSSLTSIAIPASVTSIGDSAFFGCSSLTSIEIPASVTSIDSSAFSFCSRLIIYCESSSKPSGWDRGWNSSDKPVVWNCKNNDIADDGNIYYVADNGIRYALKDGKAGIVRQSTALSGSIKIPSAVIYKGTSYSVMSIGEDAFYNCKSLTSIEIPAGVTGIGGYAFYNCNSLTSIEIPASVTSIGNSAFYGCSSLTIYCEASSKPPSGWSSSWNYSNRPVVWGHKISK